MPETNSDRDAALLNAAMDELLKSRGRTKSERKAAKRKQGEATPSAGYDVPSSTFDAVDRELVTHARITHLLEELRERCAQMAEDTIVAEFEGVHRYGDKAAARIRTIELGVALRQFFAAGGPAKHKLVPLELPQDVQQAAHIWESMGVKKTYAELWQFMLSKLPEGEVSGV